MTVEIKHNAILQYLLARAREASTWRGLIMLFGGSWAALHPDQAEAVITTAITLAGAIGALFPDTAKATPGTGT